MSNNNNSFCTFFVLFLFLCSLSGACVYAYVAAVVPRNTEFRNYYLNIWFCLLMAFFAFQNLVLRFQVETVNYLTVSNS